MNFLKKLAFRFARFMSVRNGPDQLGMALLIGSFIIQIITPVTGFYPLAYVSYGL